MLTTLRRIVLEFSQDAELERALLRMVSQVKSALNTDCCSIYLADYKKEQFVLMASDGLAKDSLGHTRIGFSQGLVGLVGFSGYQIPGTRYPVPGEQAAISQGNLGGHFHLPWN